MSKPVDIVKDLAPILRTGSVAVGTSIVQMIPTAMQVKKGVQIKAAAANTGIVYVGGSSVTADTDPDFDGLPIAASEGVFVPIEDVSKIYILSDTAAQKVFWMAV